MKQLTKLKMASIGISLDGTRYNACQLRVVRDFEMGCVE